MRVLAFLIVDDAAKERERERERARARAESARCTVSRWPLLVCGLPPPLPPPPPH